MVRYVFVTLCLGFLVCLADSAQVAAEYMQKYGIENVGKHGVEKYKEFEKRWGETNLKKHAVEKLKLFSKKFKDVDIKKFGLKALESYKLDDLYNYGVRLLDRYEAEVIKRFPIKKLKVAEQIKCSFAKTDCEKEKRVQQWFELESNYRAKKVCEIGGKMILKMKLCQVLDLK